MNSYKKGEDTATVVVLLLMILAAVWLWKNNTGTSAHAENNVKNVNLNTVSANMERQPASIGDKPSVAYIQVEQSNK